MDNVETIKLLRTTDLKTYEIGEKVGYNNMSPMEYKKSIREE